MLPHPGQRSSPPSLKGAHLLVPDLEFLRRCHLDLAAVTSASCDDVGYELAYIPSILACLDLLKAELRPRTHSAFLLGHAVHDHAGFGSSAVHGWFPTNCPGSLTLNEADVRLMIEPTTRHLPTAVAMAEELAQDMFDALAAHWKELQSKHVVIACYHPVVRDKIRSLLWGSGQRGRWHIIDSNKGEVPQFRLELERLLAGRCHVTPIQLQPSWMTRNSQMRETAVVLDTNMINDADEDVLDGAYRQDGLSLVVLDTVAAEAQCGTGGQQRAALLQNAYRTGKAVRCSNEKQFGRNWRNYSIDLKGDSAIIAEHVEHLRQNKPLRSAFITADLMMAVRMLVAVTALKRNLDGDHRVISIVQNDNQRWGVYRHPKLAANPRWGSNDDYVQNFSMEQMCWLWQAGIMGCFDK